MKLIHMENLDRSIFFPKFDSDNVISRKATMNETIVLQLSAVVGNWLIHGCQILICKNFWYFAQNCMLLSILLSFFLINKTFLQIFLFTKRTIVFWDLSLSGLPNLWQTSISWISTKTSISAKTDITDSSKTSSETNSEISLHCYIVLHGLIHILRIVSHIYTLTVHFRLADFW